MRGDSGNGFEFQSWHRVVWMNVVAKHVLGDLWKSTRLSQRARVRESVVIGVASTNTLVKR